MLLLARIKMRPRLTLPDTSEMFAPLTFQMKRVETMTARLGRGPVAARKCLLVLACLLLGQAGRSQILTNGGFESGWSGWTTNVSSGGAATFANNTTDIHSGTNALLVTVSNAGTASNSVQLVSSSFAANSSDMYILRFWISSSMDFAKLGVNLLGAVPAYPQIPFQISTNADSYQEYLYAFRASGTVSIAFDFQQTGSYWLDDIEVLDLTNTDGWDVPTKYLWQWGQWNFAQTNSVGWGGADNDKSVLLPDGSVAWIFNDTWTMVLTNWYSNIHGGGSLPRNSVVHQMGTNLYWMNNGTATFFVPTNAANLFWIGDSVVESNKVLVLLDEINATAITNVSIAVATLSLPSLALQSIVEVPSPGTANYGAFINGGDGYYYIYNGAEVARAAVGSLAVSSAWTYWNGSAWVTNCLESSPLPNLEGAWSLTQLGPGNFADIYMPGLDWTIMAQFAPSPMGPWSQPVPVYDTAYEWGELNYAPNICAGTASNGVYTIGYSDNDSPDGLAKVAADKSFYNPHFIRANLWQLSPYSLLSGSGGPGSRISIKFAADHNYGYDAINNVWGAGVLNTTNWFNLYGPDGASNGVSPVPFYTSGANKYPSGAVLVYSYASEINSINNDAPLTNNVALLDGFISGNNNCWYLSVTNLDAPFTNGYKVYFYYNGGVVGRGGQNYVRYHAGQTTNTHVLGLAQWNMYATTTNNNGQFIQDLTPLNAGTSGETPGANYCVFSNLSGGAFDLLITNGNYGGVAAIEIVANPAATTCSLTASTNAASYGQVVTLGVSLTPAPPNGETVSFLDGGTLLGVGTLSGGAAYSTNNLVVGSHGLTAVYGGDGNYLASTSAVVTVTVSPSLSTPVVWPAANAYVGQTLTLVCSNYAGGPPYNFQWQASSSGLGCTNIGGATTNELVLANVNTNNSGDYQLVLSVNGQSVTSAVAQVTVNPLPTLSAQIQGGQLVVSWPRGVLLQATSLLGPWTTNNATSPHTNVPIGPQMYYRLLVQ
jgi:hypothetical protein